MADDTYKKYKEQQGEDTSMSGTRIPTRLVVREERSEDGKIIRRLVRVARSDRDIASRRRLRPTPSIPPGAAGQTAAMQLDYTSFKAGLEELKLEMREQHRQATEGVRAEIQDQHRQTRVEVQTASRNVLAAVKASPAEYINLLCEFGGLFLVFALAVRVTLKIELVNAAFAVFMLFALGVYWTMAKVKRRSSEKGERNLKA
jgi:hypothetical protein